MSYLVLARKWRPQKFDDVVNQKHVVSTLQNALKTQRLANAYLFAGPRGIGKTTIARILSKAINCEQALTDNPCNECDSCIDITAGRSLDVFEIDGASNRGIDEVRNLREGLKYAPNPGKHKIYIIDEVHMLTTEAFNALLKTLEEPPSHVKFIFATTEPHKVLATIISRCQRFDFKRIATEEIVNQLKNICNRENIDIDDESLHLIARKAEGGMRDSQSLLDQAISFCGTKISVSNIVDLMGVIDWEIFFKFTAIINKQDIKAGFELIDTVFCNGYDLVEFLLGINEHLRNILIIKTVGSVELIESSDSFKKRYKEIALNFEEHDILRLIQIASDAQFNLKRSSNPRLYLEMIITKMIRLNKTQKIDDLIQGIDSLKEKLFKSDIISNSGYTAKPAVLKQAIISDSPDSQISTKKKNETQIEKTELTHSEKNATELSSQETQISGDTKVSANQGNSDSIALIKQQWPQIIEKIKKKKIALGSFLDEGTPEEIIDNELVIAFGLDNSFHVSSINRNKKNIEAIINEILGTKLKIKCIQTESATGNINTDKNDSSKPNGYVDRLGQKIPLIKTIVDEFDGELIK